MTPQCTDYSNLLCGQQLFVFIYSKGSPTPKTTRIFGHCPNCNLTPPIAQIRALCVTTILPKIWKFFKQQFWLWEWIFWQWLRSKMILRWYSDGNQGKYWWNWWKLGGSVLVYVHCRTATNNLGKCFDPPPFPAMPKFTRFFLGGASLSPSAKYHIFQKV